MTTPLYTCFATLCQELAASGQTEAQAEAWHILTHVTGASRIALLTQWRETLSQGNRRQIASILRQRKTGIPLAYILGKWWFCGHLIAIHKGVLIPRPETELLVSVAQTFIQKDTHIFELGVGSGAIPMALAMAQNIHYDGWDISKRSIRNAKENLAAYGQSQIRLHHQSFFAKTAYWRKAMHASGHSLFVSNPPYIPPEDMSGLQAEVHYEPRQALVGGYAGLSFYKRLFAQCLRQNPPCHMVVEVGIDQSGPLSALLEKYPNYAHTWHVDLADIPRVLAIFPRESLNAPPT
jgi:release factor glutamine methyltransferase